MKYIHFNHHGGPEVLELREGEVPLAGPGQVQIRVEASGVNRPDVLQRKGHYPPPPGASPVLGLEVAGTVSAVGPEQDPKRGLKVGDRVCALLAGGGYAQYCVAPAAQCLPIPSGLTFEEAAGIPETFFTVWANVFERGRLQAGESFLVHGGTSGIGVAAIQLARAFGARVLATAGSEQKTKFCCELGTEAAINYREKDFVEELRRATAGKGVNLILDMVGGDYFQKNLELLAQDGRLVQIAFQKGDQVSLSLRALMSKGAFISGSTLRARSPEQKGAIAKPLFEKVWPLFEEKKIRVIIDRVFPLSQAADAHRRMESGDHIGKIILRSLP